MISIIHAIESLNIWIGRAFGWCILILTLSVAYEVFVRYVLNAPTVWAFDMMVQMYGALFLMAGPYALAQDTHVRADVIYRFLQPRWQAVVDLSLYILFFFSRHACTVLVRLGNCLRLMALSRSQLEQSGPYSNLLF